MSAVNDAPILAHGFAQAEAGGPFSKITIQRRQPRKDDVVIDIHYCGICHTDMNDLKTPLHKRPLMPGHEIAGVVARVGPGAAEHFKVGDKVGIGYFIDSCKMCSNCGRGKNNYCHKYAVATFGAPVPDYIEDHADFQPGLETTCGGFSTCIVADWRSVVKIPDSMDLSKVAPLVCSAITVYTPLKKYNAGPDKSVGVMGLGGLGHMAVKLAKAMGAKVTVLSTSNRKKEYALNELGADVFVASTDKEALKTAARSVDIVIDTVGEVHQPEEFFSILRHEGVWCVVGIVPEAFKLMAVALIGRGLAICGSLVGSTPDCQEMINLCAEKGIASDVEVVPFESINDIFEKVERNEMPPGKSRFVLDIVNYKP